MIVKHKLSMDLAGQAGVTVVDMMQGDQDVRQLEISLYSGGAPWPVPAGTRAVASFRRADGAGGSYDTMGTGEPAWSAAENVLTVDVAPQVLAAAGPVVFQLSLYQGSGRISTFAIVLSVHRVLGGGEEGGGAAAVTGFLSAPQQAAVGQYFRVAEVNSRGAVTRVEAVDLPDWEGSLQQALAQAQESGAFRGQSAYELAVEKGFSGTEEEWLESLSGAKPNLGDIQQLNVTGALTTDPAVLVQFHGSRLQGISTPVQDTDAATKGYADRAARLAAAPYLVPEDWQTAVEETVRKVTALQDAGGRNCLSFACLSDCHAAPGWESPVGHLTAAVMDRCGIPFALLCGDAAGEAESEEALRGSHAAAEKNLRPMGWERLLQAQGETDGGWNGGKLTKNAVYGGIFRKFSGDLRRVSGGDGSYYYLDHPGMKLRFLVLNSSEDGQDFGYGSEQLNWLAETALSFPGDGWAVVLAAHALTGAKDEAVLQGILDARCWKRKYTGTSGTAGQAGYVSVSCDFTGTPAVEIIGFFGGHTHRDAVTVDTHPWAAVTVADCSAEPVVDFVTVNRQEGQVFLTRLGRGGDRCYGYGAVPYLLYRVTENLQNCVCSGGGTLVEAQDYYYAELTAAEGCTLTSVTVSMGGRDVTAECYSDGVIEILEVTGDIVITAQAA